MFIEVLHEYVMMREGEEKEQRNYLNKQANKTTEILKLFVLIIGGWICFQLIVREVVGRSGFGRLTFLGSAGIQDLVNVWQVLYCWAVPLALRNEFWDYLCVCVYLLMCACLGDQKSTLDPWCLSYRWLWAAQHGYWEVNLAPLEDHWALLTAELSL